MKLRSPFLESKSVFVIAAALTEELVECANYLSKNYSTDNAINDILRTVGIAPFCVDKNDSVGKKIASTITCSVSTGIAYSLSKNTSGILLQTGYGTRAVEYAFTKLFSRCIPRTVYFAGAGLGISESLCKGDCVDLMRAFRYDSDTQNASTTSMRHKIGMMHTSEYNDNASSTMCKGVAITGDVFVDIIKQRTHTPINKGNELMLLPKSAQQIIKQLVIKSPRTALVLDMESSAVFESIQNLQTTTNTISKLFLMRVILDTIYDIHKINFREDIRQVSKSIAQWIIPQIERLEY